MPSPMKRKTYLGAWFVAETLVFSVCDAAITLVPVGINVNALTVKIAAAERANIDLKIFFFRNSQRQTGNDPYNQ